MTHEPLEPAGGAAHTFSRERIMKSQNTTQSHHIGRSRRRSRTADLLRAAELAQDPDHRRQALDDVVVLNMEVARSVVASYSGRGIPAEDLEQVAYAALVRAARNFDPDQANDLLAYAVPTVRGEVKKYFRDYGWVVRPPRRLQELQAEVARGRARLQQQLGREPTLAEIAEELGVQTSEVDEALSADGCFAPTSLDRPVGDRSSTTLGEILPAPPEELEAAEARLMLWPVVGRLPKRDRTILRLRFWEGWTQQEIGEQLGVTQMQVSRLLSRILADLHQALTGDPVEADSA
jgi:RNA polymerase sigma-B factor